MDKHFFSYSQLAQPHKPAFYHSLLSLNWEKSDRIRKNAGEIFTGVGFVSVYASKYSFLFEGVKGGPSDDDMIH